MEDILVYQLDDLQISPYTNLTFYSQASIKHRHVFFEFALVLDGHCYNQIDDRPKRKLQKGDLIFLRPSDTHTITPIDQIYKHRDFYVTQEKMKQICDALSDSLYDQITSPNFPLEYTVSINEFTSLEAKAISLSKTYSLEQKPTPFTEALHASIISQLLGYMIYKPSSSESASVPQWLEKLYLEIEQFKYITNSVDDIVREMNYSHSYVCQKFKQTYGITLIAKLNQSKVMYSVNLLGVKKIIDISIMLGWENPKNYTIEFKRVYGMTPSEYIKKNPPKKVEKNHEFIAYRGLI
jgi:AraC-like DNA-binding protein